MLARLPDRGRGLALVLLALAAMAPPARPDEALRAGLPGPAAEAARPRLPEEARAEAILSREEGRGRPFDPAYRAEVKARLAEASTEDLDAVDKRGYGLLPDAQALGDSSADLVYTPVAPCRLVDTRLAGGALAAGSQRNFVVAGSIGFTGQGGNPAGCGVPLGPATAAVLNFVAVAPTGPGNLRAWAYGGTTPNASIINYAAVGMNIANAVVVPICDATAAACGPADVTVQADVSASHLVADVVGYFRSVVKGQYRSFTVQGARTAVHDDIPATGCTNVGGTQVVVTAPVAGRIVVRGRAVINMTHLAGVRDHINVTIGTSGTECPLEPLWGVISIPTDHGPATGWSVEVNPTRSFIVAAGTHTFYLNTGQVQGGGNDVFIHGALFATFEPN
jgi:hypothetical protein